MKGTRALEADPTNTVIEATFKHYIAKSKDERKFYTPRANIWQTKATGLPKARHDHREPTPEPEPVEKVLANQEMPEDWRTMDISDIVRTRDLLCIRCKVVLSHLSCF